MQKNLRSISIEAHKKGLKQTKPLSTKDLVILPFAFFSEPIQVRTTFRRELWPRQKIVCIKFLL